MTCLPTFLPAVRTLAMKSLHGADSTEGMVAGSRGWRRMLEAVRESEWWGSSKGGWPTTSSNTRTPHALREGGRERGRGREWGGTGRVREEGGGKQPGRHDRQGDKKEEGVADISAIKKRRM